MNATRNTLPAAAREISIKLLNSAVADFFDWYARTKQAHWNVGWTDLRERQKSFAH